MQSIEDAGSFIGADPDTTIIHFQLVAFLSNGIGVEIPRALLYLKHVEDGDSAIDAAGYANTFFCADGEIISPERIQSIEQLNTIA